MALYAPLAVGFTHVPKNGGTSIVHWFTDNVPQTKKINKELNHITARQLYVRHPDISMMFAVVRNPWSRYVSWYHFLVQSRADKAASQLKDDNVDIGFERFVKEMLHHPAGEMNWATQQVVWLDAKVDIIMRAENLTEDFKVIQQMYGKTAPLGVVNTTQHLHYTTYYTPELVNIIGDAFSDDVKRFNYDFQ